MVNLYQKPYLIYLNGFAGKVQIFNLNYNQVSKFNSSITVPSDNNISLCVVENLILINTHNEYMSMVYGIK